MDLNVLLQVLNILAILGSVAFFVFKIDKRLAVVDHILSTVTGRIEKIDKDLERLAHVTIEIARQDERMTAQDVRITQLSSRLDEHVVKDRLQRKRT